jgi:hypothetical protein
MSAVVVALVEVMVRCRTKGAFQRFDCHLGCEVTMPSILLIESSQVPSQLSPTPAWSNEKAPQERARLYVMFVMQIQQSDRILC